MKQTSTTPPRTLLCASLALAAACGLAEGPAAKKPNILIILADDLGYSDLGCYGSEIATPNLDSLARDGLRFTQCYNTARCWSTRCALMTGYYPQQTNQDPRKGLFPVWTRTLAQQLKPFGYRCYHSGKWHVTGTPKPVADGGFDRSYDLEDHNRNFNPRQVLLDDVPQPPVEKDSGYYTSTAFADHAVRCLKEHAERHAGEPFFSYLAFTVPHFPLQAPAEDVARYRARYTNGWEVLRSERVQRMRDMGLVACGLSAVEPQIGPPYSFPAALEKLGPGEVNRPLPWASLTPGQRAFQADKMAVHAAMVDRMDREIGRVLAQLRAMGAFDNTLILFASDNGASAEIMVRGDGHDPQAEPGSAGSFLCLGPGWSNAANTPFRRHKTWVHEGGIATPLIAHWTQGIAARNGLRRDLCHVIDFVPTALAVAGAPVAPPPGAPPFPGRDLVPAFAADGAVTRDALFFSHEGNRALRMGDYKLVSAKCDGGAWELYDLANDRAEQNNLAAAQPDRVRDMAARWQALDAACAQDAGVPRPPPGKAAPARRQNAQARSQK
jgi:arylsulfatase